eukprot:2919809-Rhodomonas_salina.1
MMNQATLPKRSLHVGPESPELYPRAPNEDRSRTFRSEMSVLTSVVSSLSGARTVLAPLFAPAYPRPAAQTVPGQPALSRPTRARMHAWYCSAWLCSYRWRYCSVLYAPTGGGTAVLRRAVCSYRRRYCSSSGTEAGGWGWSRRSRRRRHRTRRRERQRTRCSGARRRMSASTRRRSRWQVRGGGRLSLCEMVM